MVQSMVISAQPCFGWYARSTGDELCELPARLDRWPDVMRCSPHSIVEWADLTLSCVQSSLARVVLPSEIEICKTADGSDWLLGDGTFGEVSIDQRLTVFLVSNVRITVCLQVGLWMCS